MARYIDAEALTAEFKRLTLGENSLIERVFADGVYAVIDTFPTSDVAPKSEVERLQEINNLLLEAGQEWQKRYENLAREIFEEIESISTDFPIYGNVNTVILSERDLAFIKKKYTEGGEE